MPKHWARISVAIFVLLALYGIIFLGLKYVKLGPLEVGFNEPQPPANSAGTAPPLPPWAQQSPGTRVTVQEEISPTSFTDTIGLEDGRPVLWLRYGTRERGIKVIFASRHDGERRDLQWASGQVRISGILSPPTASTPTALPVADGTVRYEPPLAVLQDAKLEMSFYQKNALFLWAGLYYLVLIVVVAVIGFNLLPTDLAMNPDNQVGRGFGRTLCFLIGLFVAGALGLMFIQTVIAWNNGLVPQLSGSDDGCKGMGVVIVGGGVGGCYLIRPVLERVGWIPHRCHGRG